MDTSIVNEETPIAVLTNGKIVQLETHDGAVSLTPGQAREAARLLLAYA